MTYNNSESSIHTPDTPTEGNNYNKTIKQLLIAWLTVGGLGILYNNRADLLEYAEQVFFNKPVERAVAAALAEEQDAFDTILAEFEQNYASKYYTRRNGPNHPEYRAREQFANAHVLYRTMHHHSDGNTIELPTRTDDYLDLIRRLPELIVPIKINDAIAILKVNRHDITVSFPGEQMRKIPYGTVATVNIPMLANDSKIGTTHIIFEVNPAQIESTPGYHAMRAYDVFKDEYSRERAKNPKTTLTRGAPTVTTTEQTARKLVPGLERK